MSMVISESKGRIQGITLDGGNLNFSVVCPLFKGVYFDEVENVFTFNRNLPDKMTFEEFFKKRVKITVEIIEE